MRLMTGIGIALLMAGTATPSRRIIDGTVDAREWRGAVRHQPLSPIDGRQQPYTEVRTIRGEAGLDILVYMADDDLRSNDRLDLTIEGNGHTYHLYATPHTVRTPTGIVGAVGVDGSVDGGSPGADEEWIVELQLPWSLWGDRATAGTWTARRFNAGGAVLAGEGRF